MARDRGRGRRSASSRRSTPAAPPATGATAHVRLEPPRLLVPLALAALLAFAPGFRAPFIFDDVASIPENATIERLWPPSIPLRPPSNTTVSGRPVVNYSLALNHALNEAIGIDQSPDPGGRYKTVGFHLANFLLHLACGALLFGIVGRTLRHGRVPVKWSTVANPAAAVITGIWLLHPIQAEAVNYIIQRTELIVATCYAATLYASIRAWDAPGKRERITWYAAAVLACLLGMGSKEVMITAPLTVVLYDRTFRATSWRDVIAGGAGRRWFYLALLATMAWSAALVTRGSRAETVGFGLGLPWYRYLYTQAWAIPHYVRLVLWPDLLTVDYGQSPLDDLRGVPGAILLPALFIATIVACVRGHWLGFVGAWCFLILAPSSSFVPIRTEIAAERRFYLPLLSVLVLLVASAVAVRRRLTTMPDPRRRWWTAAVLAVVALFYVLVSGHSAERLAGALLSSSTGGPSTALAWAVRVAVGAAAAGTAWLALRSRDRRSTSLVLGAVGALLVAATFERSRKFADPEALWRDAVAKVPDNPRAYDNLAAVIARTDPVRTAEAEVLLRRAIAIDSTYLTGWTNLAALAAGQRRFAEAKALLERALAIEPTFARAVETFGGVLLELGEVERAIPYLERAASRPTADRLIALAGAYGATRRLDEAAAALRRATELDPARADAPAYLGELLIDLGRPAEAVPYLENAAERDGGSSLALLSVAYAELGLAREAEQAAGLAVERGGGDARVLVLAGRAMLRAGQAQKAEEYLTDAVRRLPTDPEAMTRLGMAKATLGKRGEAAALFRRALASTPGYPAATRALHELDSGARPAVDR